MPINETISVIKYTSWMCDNKYSLGIYLTEDGFITYRLWSGHDTSGIPNALSNLTSKFNKEYSLPDETLEGETKAMFTHRVAKLLTDTRAVKSVVNIVNPKKVKFAD